MLGIYAYLMLNAAEVEIYFCAPTFSAIHLQVPFLSDSGSPITKSFILPFSYSKRSRLTACRM